MHLRALAGTIAAATRGAVRAISRSMPAFGRANPTKWSPGTSPVVVLGIAPGVERGVGALQEVSQARAVAGRQDHVVEWAALAIR